MEASIVTKIKCKQVEGKKWSLLGDSGLLGHITKVVTVSFWSSIYK